MTRALRGLELVGSAARRASTTMADPRDPVLASKAKEIIRNEPGRYLLQGAKKFATTIGVAPYYFGTGGSGGHTNPLGRTELLPSMAGLGCL